MSMVIGHRQDCHLDHTSGCDYDDDDNNDDDDDDYDNDDTSIAGPSTDLRLASKL